MMPAELLRDFSIEITGKDSAGLRQAQAQARAALPAETHVNVTFLATESLELRIGAARTVKELGLHPVPHVSARRLASEQELRDFLSALQDVGATRSLFAVGGDPPQPAGPYPDALALIRSGLLGEYGAATVGIGGYPEGHPDIDDDALWRALTDKAEALKEAGLAGEIITQFGFDAAAALAWIEQVRARSIELPVRVGVPGPAGVKRLLAFARRFGANSSATIARKYGLSLTNLLSVAGPDRFLAELASGLDPARHGRVAVHFYTFGGVEATADWAREHAHALTA